MELKCWTHFMQQEKRPKSALRLKRSIREGGSRTASSLTYCDSKELAKMRCPKKLMLKVANMPFPGCAFRLAPRRRLMTVSKCFKSSFIGLSQMITSSMWCRKSGNSCNTWSILRQKQGCAFLGPKGTTTKFHKIRLVTIQYCTNTFNISSCPM